MLTPSKFLFFSCLTFIIGISLSFFVFLPNLPEKIIFWFFILTLIFLLISFRFFFIFALLFFLIFGFFHSQNFQLKIKNNSLTPFWGKIIQLKGKISQQPERGEKVSLYVIEIDGMKERILLITNTFPQYHYGDEILLEGFLDQPEDEKPFLTAGFLATRKIFGRMLFPKIKLLSQNKGNFLLRILYSFKEKFQEKFRQFISPPHLGVLEALVFGQESEIPKDFKEKLNLTGTRHITAVSGMNLSIITISILNLLLFFKLWRNQALFFSIVFIFLYLAMIGFPASGVRAAIMTTLALLAQYFGRISSAQRAVVFAATLMLLKNPLLLKYDLGFQLSFLAILGIIFWQEFFTEKMKKIPNFSFFPARTTLATTISAQVFTFPFLIYNFGKISLVTPITNLLIVPFLAPLTFFFFLFGLISFISETLSYFISFLVWFFLNYLVTIVNFFSTLPLAFISLKFSSCVLLVLYLLLIFLTWKIRKERRYRFLGFVKI